MIQVVSYSLLALSRGCKSALSVEGVLCSGDGRCKLVSTWRHPHKITARRGRSKINDFLFSQHSSERSSVVMEFIFLQRKEGYSAILRSSASKRITRGGVAHATFYSLGNTYAVCILLKILLISIRCPSDAQNYGINALSRCDTVGIMRAPPSALKHLRGRL
ncbi:hypothetical protein BZA77DRAFT_178353 [Pyronema omphalodes]|nr:hypothetical protein BZA77DRAFT_178353 [Pyronema omphalodes]